MDGRLVLEEYLHPDEWLAALLREHVPGLGPRQEVGHGALAQPQHRLAEQPLADAVLAEDLLCLPCQVVCVEVGVLIELKGGTSVKFSDLQSGK